MFPMPRRDPDLSECLAYALWRSPWRKRLEGLDACRMAAQDIERHLKRSGYELERRPAMEPHGRLAQAHNENNPSKSD